MTYREALLGRSRLISSWQWLVLEHFFSSKQDEMWRGRGILYVKDIKILLLGDYLKPGVAFKTSVGEDDIDCYTDEKVS